MTAEAEPRRRSIKWDEANLAAHNAVRGVEFGTMKIEQPNTPFLYLLEDGADTDEAATPNMAIHSNYLPTHLPTLTAAEAEAAGPRQMSAEKLAELQERMGLIETNDNGEATLMEPKYAAVSDAEFEAKRQAFYAGEARVGAACLGLPEGWVARGSTSEPGEIYYVHIASDGTETAQWARPGSGEASGGGEPQEGGGAGPSGLPDDQ